MTDNTVARRPRPALPQGQVERTIAARVKQLRAARGLSTRALADLLQQKGRSIHDSAVSKIELGSRRITVDDLAAMLEIFNVSFEEMVKPASCSLCFDTPPPGFTCNSCGKTTNSNTT